MAVSRKDMTTVKKADALRVKSIPNKFESKLKLEISKIRKREPINPEIRISLPILFLRMNALRGIALNIEIGPISATPSSEISGREKLNHT
jgi:hypothetical protein